MKRRGFLVALISAPAAVATVPSVNSQPPPKPKGRSFAGVVGNGCYGQTVLLCSHESAPHYTIHINGDICTEADMRKMAREFGKMIDRDAERLRQKRYRRQLRG